VIELRHSYAMSHLPYSYEFRGDFFKPFVLGVDDGTADNIKDRVAWSEGRGHYWLWKNVKFFDNEFVAINQYRRCFFFFPLLGKGTPYERYAEHLHKNPTQTIHHFSRAEYIDFIHYIEAADKAPLNEWLEGVDVVVNRPLEYPRPIGVIYGEHHRREDWEVFAAVCRRNGFDDGRHRWLTGHLMFVMRPWVFDEYMTAWWKVMSEVDQIVQHEDDPYQHRKLGYMSERFMSAWLLRIRLERPALRIQTLPIAEGLFQFDRPAPGVM
jgi:Domain of unknown function (DUF4422)